jgi:hypothetical protein
MTDKVPHRALDLAIERRIDYLRVLAAVTAVDDTVGAEELGVLGEFCDTLGVIGAHREEILRFTQYQRRPDRLHLRHVAGHAAPLRPGY